MEYFKDINAVFRHVGYTVKDVGKAVKKLQTAFPGMDPWKFCTCTMSSDEVVDNRSCHLIIALSRVNGTAIELVEALDDCPDCYHAQLEDWSSHVSFVYPPDRYDEIKAYLLNNGYTVAFGALQQKSGEKCFYFEPEDGGPVLEFNNIFPEDPEYDSLEKALADL